MPDSYYLVDIVSKDTESTDNESVATESMLTAIESEVEAFVELELPEQAVNEAITTSAKIKFFIFCCFYNFKFYFILYHMV